MRKPLGQMLVEAGVIDDAKLKVALADQAKMGRPLGRTLVELRMMEEEDLVRVLSQQLNLPSIDLEAMEIPPDVVALIPAPYAQQHQIMPFALTGKFLDLAMAEPTNVTVLEELRIRMRLNIRPYLTGARMIDRVIGKYYGGGPNPNLGGRMAPSRGKRATADSVPLEDEPLAFDTDVSADDFAVDDRPATVPVAPVRKTVPPPVAPPVPPEEPAPRRASTTGAPPNIEALLARIAQLEALVLREAETVQQLAALVERDEEVLKKLLALLIEKGITTRDEIVERLG